MCHSLTGCPSVCRKHKLTPRRSVQAGSSRSTRMHVPLCPSLRRWGRTLTETLRTDTRTQLICISGQLKKWMEEICFSLPHVMANIISLCSQTVTDIFHKFLTFYNQNKWLTEQTISRLTDDDSNQQLQLYHINGWLLYIYSGCSSNTYWRFPDKLDGMEPCSLLITTAVRQICDYCALTEPEHRQQSTREKP